LQELAGLASKHQHVSMLTTEKKKVALYATDEKVAKMSFRLIEEAEYPGT
jgi:hypothetical protein